MTVLVIPDIHLKPWILYSAMELMRSGVANRAVCLMDIPDDWGKELDLDAYEQTYNAAIDFAKEYPDTLWCYGNHDVCYLWDQRESGYSFMAADVVCLKLQELQETIPNDNQLAYLHRVDNVLFSHGGLSDLFVRKYTSDDIYDDIDAVIQTINSLGVDEMWQDDSPIWYRPQYRISDMYKGRGLVQVVGHTPVKWIEKYMNLISCDVFSTHVNGKPLGTQSFPLIDTVSGEVVSEFKTSIEM